MRFNLPPPPLGTQPEKALDMPVLMTALASKGPISFPPPTAPIKSKPSSPPPEAESQQQVCSSAAPPPTSPPSPPPLPNDNAGAKMQQLVEDLECSSDSESEESSNKKSSAVTQSASTRVLSKPRKKKQVQITNKSKKKMSVANEDTTDNRIYAGPVGNEVQQDQQKQQQSHRAVDFSSEEEDLEESTTSSSNAKATERVFIDKTWSVQSTFIVSKNGGSFEVIQFTRHGRKPWSFGVGISNARKILEALNKLLARLPTAKRNVGLEDLVHASRDENGDLRLDGSSGLPIKRKIFRFNNIEVGIDVITYPVADGTKGEYDGFFIRRHVGNNLEKNTNNSQDNSSAPGKRDYLGVHLPLRHLEPMVTALTFVLRRRWRSLHFPGSPFTAAMRRACAIEEGRGFGQSDETPEEEELVDEVEMTQSKKAEKRSTSIQSKADADKRKRTKLLDAVAMAAEARARKRRAAVREQEKENRRKHRQKWRAIAGCD